MGDCAGELGSRLESARKALSESYPGLPGGAAWAGALRAALELLEGPPGGEALPGDPVSDLLDHARLLRSPSLSGPRVAELREAERRRGELLLDVRKPGGASGPAIDELLALYRGLGAARKAREAAFYLVASSPGDPNGYRRLAASLPAPEEVVARLWAAKKGLRLAPGDPALLRVEEEALAFLGLKGP